MSSPLVPQEMLDTVVATAIAKVCDGCRDSRAAGNLVKYPDAIEFEVIMLVDANAIERQQVTAEAGGGTVTTTDAPSSTTRTTTNPEVTTVNTRSGGDSATQDNTHSYFDEGGPS